MTGDCGCPPTSHGRHGVDRRRFLTGLGLAGAAAVGAPLLSSRAAYAATGSWDGPVLVVLSLRGGFDGLSAVAPLGDPDYARRRPSIALPQTVALPTGDPRFGLHPSFASLAPLWARGQMAAVHAVGTPDGSRSHFTAMEELERAAPGTSLRTGWLDRVLGAAGTGTVFEAVQLGSGTPAPLLAGPAPVLATGSLAGFTLSSADWVGPRMAATLTALHTGTTLPAAAPALLTLAALDSTAAVVAGDRVAHNGAAYPAGSPLGAALADGARLVRAGLGLQTLTIDVGNWDMHAGLGITGSKGWMATQLKDLSDSLAAFATDLGALLDRVTVLTISEFGRRANENGLGGADHGHGNVVLLLGGGLNGGRVHGRWPGLTDPALDQGDLAGTTDYRDVLAEYLTRRFGLSAGALAGVFPGLVPAPPGVFR